MFRALRFIAVAVILLALAWWIGTIPGTFTAVSGPYTVQTRVPVAILLLLLIAILFTVLLRVIGGLRRAPGGFGAWRGGRRNRLGEIATQRGIVALAAGDAKAAESEAVRARKLLGDTPLVLLLVAESARLAGKTDESKAAFAQLTSHKEMAFLGHRGLVRHSFDQGDHDAADGHAAAAETAYPGAAWLKTKRLDIAVQKQDFRNALSLARSPAEIAAFATAAAAAADDRRAAFAYAKQAVKADPSLAPAVVAYATALRNTNRARAAKKALSTGWAAAPHPLIAAAYLDKITSPIERAQAAATLAAARPGDAESELLLAETSLAAKLTGEARRHAEAALAAGLTDRRVYAVLAALDDQSAAAALTNALSPKWICAACHTAHETWSPICPTCQKPGTLAWKPPVQSSEASRQLSVIS